MSFPTKIPSPMISPPTARPFRKPSTNQKKTSRRSFLFPRMTNRCSNYLNISCPVSDSDSLSVGIEIPSRNVRVDARVMLDGKNGGRTTMKSRETEPGNRVTFGSFGESASKLSESVVRRLVARLANSQREREMLYRCIGQQRSG